MRLLLTHLQAASGLLFWFACCSPHVLQHVDKPVSHRYGDGPLAHSASPFALWRVPQEPPLCAWGERRPFREGPSWPVYHAVPRHEPVPRVSDKGEPVVPIPAV